MGLLIWGATSQARLLAGLARDSLELQDGTVFFHSPDGFPITFETTDPISYSSEEFRSHLPSLSHFLVAVGGTSGNTRVDIQAGLVRLGLQPADVLCRGSFMDYSTEAGSGLVLMPGAVVNKYCRIGDQCIINTNASVDHECSLGDGVHVMGAAAIAGRVHVHDYASIGTNATILPDLTIGSGAVVGAGAVVTHDVEDYSIVVGSPAREVKKAELRRTFPEEIWFEQFVLKGDKV